LSDEISVLHAVAAKEIHCTGMHLLSVSPFARN
jgi:hypothetical protein